MNASLSCQLTVQSPEYKQNNQVQILLKVNNKGNQKLSVTLFCVFSVNVQRI